MNGNLRGALTRSLRLFHTSNSAKSDFSHAIVGGGVVGLAIAAELSKQSGNSILLVEKNHSYGMETSARNSEVIHGGLYYPIDSLKTKLCLRGKELIYQRAESHVELRKCGKWIVAQSSSEEEYLNKMHEKATKILDVPVEFVSLEKAKLEEPSIRAAKSVLNSPTTGIISAESLMAWYYATAQENGAEFAMNSKVVNIEKESNEYLLTVDDGVEEVEIRVDNVVNSGGLYATDISNMLLPHDRQLKTYFAKGNYFSYNSSIPKINRLNVASLGTHLTIDLGGQIKFGPDLEWIDSLNYEPNATNLENCYEAVKQYFPTIDKTLLSPSYSGIRPKLIDAHDKTFQDFVIREEDGFKGFVNLLGVESPGLTASMGIAEYVRDIYHK